IGNITGPHLLPALAQMHSLKRLSIEMKLLFPDSQVDLDYPLFACIMHLDLFEEVYIEDELEELLWLLHLKRQRKLPTSHIWDSIPSCIRRFCRRSSNGTSSCGCSSLRSRRRTKRARGGVLGGGDRGGREPRETKRRGWTERDV
ncbi:hypothetical protein R3P38DRAFT_2505314, partial [Favolaschia claudopus]